MDSLFERGEACCDSVESAEEEDEMEVVVLLFGEVIKELNREEGLEKGRTTAEPEVSKLGSLNARGSE